MASADGSILIRTKVDTSGIKQGTQSIQNGVGKINASLLKLGATMVAVFGAIGLARLGKEAISLASDLIEVQNVVDVAFGEMAYKIEDFSKSAIDNFGLSELSAKSMASTFMAMANGMKQGLNVASDMAVQMTGRLADIMSFYNKSLSEVDTIGRAVYSGETEPLKAIGVIMTETQLQIKATSMGYSELYKNMLPADKLLVRQAYFLETTNQAAGDFVRTQSSWANQTRILSERWKQFLSLIGGRLIQVLTPVVTLLNNILSSAITVGNALAKVFGWETSVASSTGAVASNVADTVDSQDELTNSAKETNKALKEQLAFFDDINVQASDSASSSGSGGSSGGVSSGGGAIGSSTVSKTEEQLSSLEKKMLDFLQNIKSAWGTADFTFLGVAFGESVNKMLSSINWDILQENVYKVGKSIATFLNGSIMSIDWNLIGKTIAEGLNTAIALADGFIQNFNFSKFGKAIGSGINGFFKNADWKKLFKNVSDLANGILISLSDALNEIDFEMIGKQIADGLEQVDWEKTFQNLGKVISAALGGSIDLLEGIRESSEKSKMDDSWLQQQLPTTLWDWISLGAATVGLDINYTFNQQDKIDALNQSVSDIAVNSESATTGLSNMNDKIKNMNPMVDLGVKYDENGWNTALVGLSDSISVWWNGTVVTWWNESIVSFFETYVAPWFTAEKWTEIGYGIGVGLKESWNNFVDYWENSAIAKWWSESVEPWFSVEKWKSLGDNMKNGMLLGFKVILPAVIVIMNAIISSFEGMINMAVAGINSLVDKFNNLPSALRLGTTMGKFDNVSLGKIPIPKLAQGGVIPPNKEFMAVLGDQKNGTNIEAPLDTIKQALAEVLNGRGNVSTQGGDLVIKVGDTELIRVLLPTLLTEMNRQGYDTTVLGAV